MTTICPDIHIKVVLTPLAKEFVRTKDTRLLADLDISNVETLVERVEVARVDGETLTTGTLHARLAP